MPTEEEKQELRELAGSSRIRDQFRLLRKNSMALQQRVDVDKFISFLTAMSRLNPRPVAPRPFVLYKQAKIANFDLQSPSHSLTAISQTNST